MKSLHRSMLSVLIMTTFISACTPVVTAIEQPISIPQPTITPTVITMDQNVEAFLSGQYDDVSNLSLEERKEFSNILTQKMNEARGARPLIYKNEAYVDPITGMMKDYNGHPDLDETIQMYLSASLDDEGILLVQNEDGTWVKINGSKDIDWNTVITDPNDPRIDWPTGHENKDGFSPPQSAINLGSKLIPMVMLKAGASELYMSGENALMQPTITILKIETDISGTPILARKVMVWGVNFILCKEGSDFFADQSMIDSWENGFEKTIKESPFFTGLENQQLYYMTIPSINQSGIYQGAKLTPINEDYENIVVVDEVTNVLFNKALNYTDMLVIASRVLIESSN